ncbi:hypothetical protein [Halorubrum sp. AS12]|uniref:Cap15 family cyclic dinucleotide receptor domain-containing protein n=1 Tax=Halorubrum sp. AS12 TaxID=3409687 RepID=UPI003DA6D4D0
MGSILMHPYSIVGARWRKVGYLMFTAVLLSSFLQETLIELFAILPFFTTSLVPPGLPTFAIFTAIFFVWDRYLWHFPLVSNFTSPPDLRGTWKGGLTSSHEQTRLGEFEMDTDEVEQQTSEETPIMVIDQTWSNIKVTIDFPHSESISTTASVIRDRTDPVLRINYRNHPRGDSPDGVGIHEGTNDLRYRTHESGDILEGKYYTDENRNNHGHVEFQRVDYDRIRDELTFF